MKAVLHGKPLVFVIILYGWTLAGSMGCRIMGARVTAADLAALRSGGLDDVVTCLTFAVLTLAMQTCLACVLEERPASAPRRPASWYPWMIAVMSWVCISSYFVAYITYGGNVAPTSPEWTVAGVASAANLAMATRTVQAIITVFW
ncbi:hypothetical protein E2562_015652 [Oryza meyeriana var. granulata]|uniref:Uncharacterized protein n=1 Tax=Oryza meyeriana var. granulata TaxID=110450 RepID=A0A6G1D485_9ORYZ|nr:hypothetical protein E2562_015652 [Oryza meyeriana var. granulata]